MNIILARIVADGVLKRFGLSRSGKTLEVRGRTTAIPEGEIADDEVVEVRCSTSLTAWAWVGVMCLGFALIGALVVAFAPLDQTEGLGWGYAIIAVFGLVVGGCLYESQWGKPQAWADGAGITGYPVGHHVRRKFVPWSSVATCEIETCFDTFGEAAIVRPILIGGDGETLLMLNLLFTKVEDQERLVKYIKAKLPKPKVDFWE